MNRILLDVRGERTITAHLGDLAGLSIRFTAVSE
jgi:hypothetical protein